MTQRPIVIAWLALSLAAGCAETTPPEISSGSNWLTCEAVDDCDDGRAVRCSDDGYCLDVQGERIAAPTEGNDSSPDAGSTPMAGQDEDGVGPSVTTDAGGPTGGAPAPGDPADAGVARATFGGLARCELPGAREPLVPRADETCWDFAVHGISSTSDATAFPIPPGESYSQFYYSVPWEAGSVATSYGVVDDSGMSIHAWLFSSNAPNAAGTVSKSVLGTVIGEEARLLGAWAIGSCNVVMPDTTGLVLPESGNVMVQWHHLNVNMTGAIQDDSSVFRVCTVPAGSRSQLAGITILGTEYLDLAPGMPTVGGTCLNDSDAPITILMLDPHMHRQGARATTVVERAAGGETTLLDAPFRFDERNHYLLEPAAVLEPGDGLRTDCTYDNTTEQNIAFGQSVFQEMCLQMAIASPPIALDNGVLSLIGALNTCW